jgi:O-antigen/teichoic acid export membrane protein
LYIKSWFKDNQQSLKSIFGLNIAIIDQVIVSGTNFLTGVLIARFLGPKEFGFFTLLWIVVLLFSNLQYALIIAPMMSIGPKQNHEDKPIYYGGLFFFQLCFSLAFISLVLLIINGLGLIMQNKHLMSIAGPLAFSGSAFLTQDYFRRLFFTRSREGLALKLDILSYLGQIFSLYVMFFVLENASIELIFIIIAVTSSLAAGLGLIKMGPISLSRSAFYKMYKRNRAFIRGTVFFTLAQWTGPQIVLFLSGLKLGTESLGGIRAVINLLAPLNILLLGLLNVLPVSASKILKLKGKRGVVVFLTKVSIPIVTLLSIVCIGILVFRIEIMSFVFGSNYIGFTNLIGWQIGYLFFDFLILVIMTYYKTVEQTELLSSSAFIGLLMSILLVWILLPILNEVATFLGLLVNQAMIALWLLLNLKNKKQNNLPSIV